MSRLRKRLLWTGGLAVVLVVAACGVFLRGEVIEVGDELPPGFPAAGFDHGSFDALLKKFVDEKGSVRYSDWNADAASMRALDRYLGAAARFSPDNAPERFPTDDDKLAYWCNVYNACVIKGVLAHWPIASVHDVQGPIEPKAGFGFFWRLRFVLGGKQINLYDLEHEIIRKRFEEPRIHFVLNCASIGCPPLRRDAVTGAGLEAHLQTTMVAFLVKDVKVNAAAETVTVSALFDWYGEDFKPSVTAWLAQRHKHAGTPGFTIVYAPWDWSINGD